MPNESCSFLRLTRPNPGPVFCEFAALADSVLPIRGRGSDAEPIYQGAEAFTGHFSVT